MSFLMYNKKQHINMTHVITHDNESIFFACLKNDINKYKFICIYLSACSVSFLKQNTSGYYANLYYM